MNDLLAMSLAGSAVVVLMLLLRPITVKIFPSKWQYRMGKTAMAFFLLPVSLFAGKLPLVQPAVESYSSESAVIRKVSPANGFTDTANALIEKHLSVEVLQAIVFLWLAGAIAFAVWHFYCYRKFTRQLRADNTPAPEDAAALLAVCKAALGIHGEVRLMQNRKIASPMLVGLRHPMILLPASNMREMDLKLVFAHELTHLKRKDLWIKILALAAGTLHWFNPFAYVLRKDVSTWGELSCDEALASGMSREERKRYGEAILNTLDVHSGINTAFCSSLGESRKHIERRLTMLLNVKKTKKHIAVFAVAAILVIGVTGVAVAAYAAENIPQAEMSLKSEGVADPASVDSAPGVLISVRLSDERKFSPEEWQDILKRIDRGEITLEPEVDTVAYAVSNGNSSTMYNSSTTQESLQGRPASTYGAYSSEGMITPDELAKVYSVYEPFGLTYDKKQNCLYYNGKLVREFIDILSSNGEALESGKFKGAMRQFSNPDGKGKVDIKAVRDYTKLNADGIGELIGVEVIK